MNVTPKGCVRKSVNPKLIKVRIQRYYVFVVLCLSELIVDVSIRTYQSWYYFDFVLIVGFYISLFG